MKLLILVILAGIACRVLFGRWPWEIWRDSQRSQDVAKARALLGVSRDATRDDILTAHRRALYSAHPDHGGSSEAVHRLNDARDLLLQRITR